MSQVFFLLSILFLSRNTKQNTDIFKSDFYNQFFDGLGYVIVSNRTFRCLATQVSVSYLNFTPIIILILLPVG